MLSTITCVPCFDELSALRDLVAPPCRQTLQAKRLDMPHIDSVMPRSEADRLDHSGSHRECANEAEHAKKARREPLGAGNVGPTLRKHSGSALVRDLLTEIAWKNTDS